MSSGATRNPLVACGALLGMVALVAGVLVAGASAAGASGAGTPGNREPGARVAFGPGVPALPGGAVRRGAVPPAQTIRIEVGLQSADPAALDAAVQAVSTPGSPDYRHYLAPGDFGPLYGASGSAIAAVRSWLASAGLHVGPTNANRLTIPASGSAAAVTAAFGTPLEQVRTASGTSAHMNTARPTVPASLAPSVLGVAGLDTAPRWRSMLVPAATPLRTHAVAPALRPSGLVPQACSALAEYTGPNGPYSNNQIAAAYGMSNLYSQGRTGAGVQIGIFELEQFSMADIDQFAVCYGVPGNVSVEAVDGGATTSAPGSGEAALDIENAMTFAPGASVRVYEGPNTGTGPLDIFQQMANDDSAKVLSTSWGICEAQNLPAGTAQMEQTIFKQMALQGQTLVAASGDSGSEDCYDPSQGSDVTSLAVDDPGSQPNVVSAGGTTMPSAGTNSGETVWNNCEGESLGTGCSTNGVAGGGGGGVSAVWPQPLYQNGLVAGTGNPCGALSGSCRLVPDVSANADPETGFVIIWDGEPIGVGGTSAVAPLWASLFAVVDQGCDSSLGNVNPALYALGASSAGGSAFHDITSGNNDFTGTNGGDYAAGTGYDLASGWGTPQGGGLLSSLQPVGGCPAVTGISGQNVPLNQSIDITVSGSDFAGATSVNFGAAGPGTILSNSGTSITVATPTSAGPLGVDVTVTTPNGTSAAVAADRFAFGTSKTGHGYWEVASDGGLFAFGSSHFYGSMGGKPLDKPVVGMAATPDDKGYWEVASDGGLFAFGDAGFYGSMGGKPLNEPIVGMAATPDGKGYWEVASDGGLFAFGDAGFYGSMGGKPLNEPIVGLASTWDGKGYWEVAADGGLFAFGDAGFYGSMGGKPLNEPIVGMTSTLDSHGYWEVAADGGLFSFGDAAFHGSMGGRPLNEPIVGMSGTPDSGGYWEVAADGGLFAFGDAGFYGSTGNLTLLAPVVGMAIA
jgi:hypothetical protein